MKVVNRSVKGCGGLLSAPYLPVFFHGSWVWLDREHWATTYLRYEPYMATAISRHLPRGGVFYDVGAHIGLWSLYAARIASGHGRVVCCEPSDAFDVLARNIRRVGQSECVNVAVGDRDGDVVFFGQGTSTGGSLVRAVTEINQHYQPGIPIAPVKVKMQSLDSLSEHRRVPDLIKVDVEGYECKVLEGAQHLMERASPTWIIEIHPPQLRESGSSEDACLALLDLSGYRVEVIDRNPNSIYTIVAKRPETLRAPRRC